MITNDQAIQIVKDLNQVCEDDLTAFEIDFIYDMQDIEKYSDRQLLKIEEFGKKHL